MATGTQKKKKKKYVTNKLLLLNRETSLFYANNSSRDNNNNNIKNSIKQQNVYLCDTLRQVGPKVAGVDTSNGQRGEGQSLCSPLDSPTWDRCELQANKSETITVFST